LRRTGCADCRISSWQGRNECNPGKLTVPVAPLMKCGTCVHAYRANGPDYGTSVIAANGSLHK
jgi:hypothetical protein